MQRLEGTQSPTTRESSRSFANGAKESPRGQISRIHFNNVPGNWPGWQTSQLCNRFYWTTLLPIPPVTLSNHKLKREHRKIRVKILQFIVYLFRGKHNKQQCCSRRIWRNTFISPKSVWTLVVRLFLGIEPIVVSCSCKKWHVPTVVSSSCTNNHVSIVVSPSCRNIHVPTLV